jgi:hypothetical protein
MCVWLKLWKATLGHGFWFFTKTFKVLEVEIELNVALLETRQCVGWSMFYRRSSYSI